MDAGLRDDAAKAKGLLINEIQRGDMARGGQTVSPNLKDKGDERLFKGAKEAIRQGLLTDPTDIEVISDKLSAKQVEELNALMTGAGRPASTLETMIPVTPTPDLSAVDGIDVTPGQQFEATPWGMPEVVRDNRTPRQKLLDGDGFVAGPPPSLGGALADERLSDEGPGWGGGALPQGIADWFRDNVEFGFGPGPADPRGGLPGNGRTPLPPGMMPEGLPPEDMMPPAGAAVAGEPPMPPSLGGQLADDRLAGSPVPPPPVEEPAAPAEDPIIELAGTASTKDEALAIADEAEASGLFPGARAKVMKAFGWDEEGAQNFGRALMGFGSGLLQGGPDFGAALGAGFAKGADEFVNAKDDRRQAALEDRRIAMEDERLDFAREEMNNKRKQAALDRLRGEAEIKGTGLGYYEDGEGRIRSTPLPERDVPMEGNSPEAIQDQLDFLRAMPEGEEKEMWKVALGFTAKPQAGVDDPLLMPAQ